MSENKIEENQEEQVPVQEQPEEKKLSPEEYAAARKKAMEHLGSEIEYLEVEVKYEKLVADVEEHKTRGITAIATRAQFFQRQQQAQQQAQAQSDAAPGGEQPPMATKPKGTRPLKTD